MRHAVSNGIGLIILGIIGLVASIWVGYFIMIAPTIVLILIGIALIYFHFKSIEGENKKLYLGIIIIFVGLIFLVLSLSGGFSSMLIMAIILIPIGIAFLIIHLIKKKKKFFRLIL